jgi:Flp pilus assembly protein TadB
MDEKNLTGQESLGIISQMIRVARDEHRESGDGWLIWGWLLFAASVLSAVFSYLEMGRYIAWVWSVMLITGLVLNIFFHMNRRKKVNTYVQDLIDRIGIGFFISLFAIIAASFLSRNHNFSFGYYYILYAFWMYIHGSALHFKPLLVGAVINWVAAVAIFIITDFKYDMIVSAIAVSAGYLVPGYMLRSEYKRNYSRQEKSPDGV